MTMKKKKKENSIDKIAHEERYVEFLRKQVQSENYKNDVPKEEFDKTKLKYDKAKLKLRTLKGNI